MWNDGGYLQTAELLGYSKKKEKVIWSTSSKLRPIPIENIIITRCHENNTTHSTGTLLPKEKLNMLRHNTKLSLMFNRNDSPKPRFAPQCHISTANTVALDPAMATAETGNNNKSTKSTKSTKSAALQRVDTLKSRRLQLSCRAINTLNDLSQSWTSPLHGNRNVTRCKRNRKQSPSNPHLSSKTTVLRPPPRGPKHYRKHRNSAKGHQCSPRKNRFRINATKDNNEKNVKVFDTPETIIPNPTPNATHKLSPTPPIPTSNLSSSSPKKAFVAQLASQFSVPVEREFKKIQKQKARKIKKKIHQDKKNEAIVAARAALVHTRGTHIGLGSRRRTFALIGAAAEAHKWLAEAHEDVEEFSDSDSDSDSERSSESSGTDSSSDEDEDEDEKEDKDNKEKELILFDSVAHTNVLIQKFVKKLRMTKELKQIDSKTHERNTYHSTDLISRLHGYLAEQKIDQLMSATGYSRNQLYSHFLRFKALCASSESPEGVTRACFRGGVPSLAMEDSLFVDRVFNIIDAERRGVLDWPHYIRAMASLEQGTPVARTAFLWSVYDKDGGGTISRSELKGFFVSSLMTTVDNFIEDVAEIFVEGVFSRITPNDRGELTLSEAMRYIENQDEVTDLHGMFGRSMAMQGFVSVVDGTRDNANEESKKEKIARRIRKIRRAQGLDSSLHINQNVLSKTNAIDKKSHHKSSLIEAAGKVKYGNVLKKDDELSKVIKRNIQNSGFKSLKQIDDELEWELNEELHEMHHHINAATVLNKKAADRRASVVFTNIKDKKNERKYTGAGKRRNKKLIKREHLLKPLLEKKMRISVAGRTNSLLVNGV
jgi:serine/threonine-protein phosphatase 2B regulatory subunit